MRNSSLVWLGVLILMLACCVLPDETGEASSSEVAAGARCGAGDPTNPPTGGGFEAIWGRNVVGVCRRALGCASSWGESTPNTADEARGTPNQKLLWRVWYYGWAYEQGTAAERRDARHQLLAFLLTQNTYGHQAVAETGYDANEILTGSHYEIWSNGMTCARLLSVVHHDPFILEATSRWWRGEAALYRLLARGSSIDAPGARYFPGQSGGWNQLRDVVHDLIIGAPLPRVARHPDGPWWSQYYNVAAWTVRELQRLGDDLGGARHVTNADLPALRDPLFVYARGDDYVFEFPKMRGALDPLFWVANIGGVKSYAPVLAGNPQTSSVAAPALPGASLVVVPGTP